MLTAYESYGGSTTGKQEDSRMNNVRPSKIETSAQLSATARWAQCKVIGKNILIRSYSAACAKGNTMYVYGGMQILNGVLSDFHQIDLGPQVQKFEWKDVKLSDPNVTPGPRAKHAMVYYEDCIYLLGGIKGSVEDSKQIYRFSIKDSLWTKLEPSGAAMPAIDSFGCVAVDGRIYLLCGYDGKACRFLNSVYQYDIASNSLSLLVDNHPNSNNAPQPRTNCSAAHEDGKIYIFGGKTEEARVNDIWAFDIAKKAYEKINDPVEKRPIVRSGHTLTSHEGVIFMFGGIHEITWELDDLNIFHPKSKLWQTIDIDSPRRRQEQKNAIQAALKPPEKRMPLKKKESLYHETLLSLPNHNNNGHRHAPNSPTNFHFTKEPSDANIGVSPGKMIDEQRKKAFLHKKAEMLKEFDVSEKQRARYINIQPVTQAMRNSLDIIGNPNAPAATTNNASTNPIVNNTTTGFLRQGSPTRIAQLNKTTCSKFLQPLTNNINLIQGKRPCARDGHNAVLLRDSIVIFGGDRHQMSFSDIFKLNLEVVMKELEK